MLYITGLTAQYEHALLYVQEPVAHDAWTVDMSSSQMIFISGYLMQNISRTIWPLSFSCLDAGLDISAIAQQERARTTFSLHVAGHNCVMNRDGETSDGEK
jgi:hypothetical protein